MEQEVQYKYNGWNEWSKYLVKSIERLENNVSMLEDKTVMNKEELIKLITGMKEEFKAEIDALKEHFTVQLNIQKVETAQLATRSKLINTILGFVGGTIISLLFAYLFSKFKL